MQDPVVTDLLAQAQNGDRVAENTLFQLVYTSLWQRAHGLLRNKTMASQLSAGTLVHEVFGKLFRGGSRVDYRDRAHFYAIATRAMRQVIIDHLRGRISLKRGSGRPDESVEDTDPPRHDGPLSIEQVIAVTSACDRLANSAPAVAQVLDFYFFGGLTVDEIAGLLGVSDTTVNKRLKFGKAFVHREIMGESAKRNAAGQ